MAGSDDDIPKINPSEVETLIKKIEQSTLSEQDKRMITRLLRTLLYLVGMLQAPVRDGNLSVDTVPSRASDRIRF